MAQGGLTGSRHAIAEAIAGRLRNILRNRHQTFSGELVPRRTSQTIPPPRSPQSAPRERFGSPCQTRPTSRSKPQRNRRTSGFLRTGKIPPHPDDEAERTARASHGRCARNPRRTAEPRRNPAPTATRQSAATAPRQSRRRQNPANPAVTRTTDQRKQLPPPKKRRLRATARRQNFRESQPS